MQRFQRVPPEGTPVVLFPHGGQVVAAAHQLYMVGAAQAQLPGGIGLHQQAVIVLVAPHPKLLHHPAGQAADPAHRRHALQPLGLFGLQGGVIAGFFLLREHQPPHFREVLHPHPPGVLLQRVVILPRILQKADAHPVEHLPALQLPDLPVEHGIRHGGGRFVEKVLAFLQRKARRPQLPAQVEPPGVGDRIIAVAGLPVHFGLDKAHFLVVAQRVGGNTQQRRHFTDGITHGTVLLWPVVTSAGANLRAPRRSLLLLYRMRRPAQGQKTPAAGRSGPMRVLCCVYRNQPS